MELHAIADITKLNLLQRQAMIQLITAAEPELRGWRPEPQRWSMLEHLEHTALIADHLTERLAELVRSGHSQGLLATRERTQTRLLDSLPALAAAGAMGRKFQTPDLGQPQGRSLEEVLAMLGAQQEQVLRHVALLEELDTDRLTWFHPVVGATLTAAQLWHFHGIHEWLHARHMQKNRKLRETDSPV